MPKVGSFVHRVDEEPLAVFNTTFSGDRYAKVDLNNIRERNPPSPIGGPFGGNIQLIRISGTIIGGSTVGTITLSGYTDVDGEQLLIEPTEAVEVKAINFNTSNRVSAIYMVDAWVNLDKDALYLFAKTATNQLYCDEIMVTWVE